MFSAVSLAAVAAFQVCPQPQHCNNNIAISRSVMEPLRSASELSPINEMCIENVAEFCLHESCDIEEYEALINQLEEQKTHFIKHVANVESRHFSLLEGGHNNGSDCVGWL